MGESWVLVFGVGYPSISIMMNVMGLEFGVLILKSWSS